MIEVVPTGMEAVFANPDPEAARRAMEAMFTMGKLDVAALRAAATGDENVACTVSRRITRP